MGLLSNIAKVVKFVNPITTALNPLRATRQALEGFTNTSIKPTKAETINTLAEGVVVGGVVGGVIAGPVGAIKGAGFGVGLGSSQAVLDIAPTLSKKVENIVKESPINAANFLQNVGSEIEKPTLEGALKILRENPFLTIATAGAFLGSLGFSSLIIAQALKIYFKETPKETTNPNPTPSTQYFPTSQASTSLPTDEGKPITPPTQTISSSSTKKRRKRSQKKEIPMINIKIDDRDIYNVSNRKLFKGASNR